MKRFGFVVFALALSALIAGCATTTSYPSASYPAPSNPAASPVLVGPNTNAPRIENSDAAGVLSVPGYHSVPPAQAVVAPVPTTVVTPAPAVVVPPPAVVVPPR